MYTMIRGLSLNNRLSVGGGRGSVAMADGCALTVLPAAMIQCMNASLFSHRHFSHKNHQNSVCFSPAPPQATELSAPGPGICYQDRSEITIYYLPLNQGWQHPFSSETESE